MGIILSKIRIKNVENINFKKMKNDKKYDKELWQRKKNKQSKIDKYIKKYNTEIEADEIKSFV